MKKRLIIAASAAVVVAAGALGGYALLNRSTPEQKLYTALSIDTGKYIGVEENADSAAGKFYGESMYTKASIKGVGSLECSGSSTYGDVDLNLTLTQVNEKVFLEYTKIHNSNGDAEIDAELNSYFGEELVNKPILLDDADSSAMSLKKYGTVFGILGAESEKMSPEEIVKKLQEHKVIEILNTTAKTIDGKQHTEYSLSVRRTAYEKFMDSVVANYEYKDEVLDMLFTNDTEEMTIVLNDKDEFAYATYSMENLCSLFMTQFDPDAALEAPTQIRIKSTMKKGSKVDAVAPATYMSAEDYALIFAEEE